MSFHSGAPGEALLHRPTRFPRMRGRSGMARRSPVLSRTRLLASLRFARRLFVGLLLCYVVAALTLGGTPRARPLFRALATLWAVALIAGSYLALRGKVLPGTWLRLGEVVLTNIALALCLGELSLQGFAAWSGRSVLLGATL